MYYRYWANRNSDRFSLKSISNFKFYTRFITFHSLNIGIVVHSLAYLNIQQKTGKLLGAKEASLIPDL